MLFCIPLGGGKGSGRGTTPLSFRDNMLSFAWLLRLPHTAQFGLHFQPALLPILADSASIFAGLRASCLFSLKTLQATCSLRILQSSRPARCFGPGFTPSRRSDSIGPYCSFYMTTEYGHGWGFGLGELP